MLPSDIQTSKPSDDSKFGDVKKTKDYSGTKGDEDLTIKGVAADPEQKRNMEVVIDTASGVDGAGNRSVLAAIVAVIQESACKNLDYGDRDSKGILQVRDSTAGPAGIDNKNIEECVEYFMEKGFWGKGGAIAVARNNPSMNAGDIAQQVQGSGVPDAYKKWLSEGKEWLEAYTGGFLTGGTNGSYRKSFQYEREENENNWDCIQRLAGDVEWRAFMNGKAFYYMSETLLFQRRTRYTIRAGDPALIDLEYDMDWGKPVNEATLTVALERWGAPPGAVIKLDGFGPPDGRWLIIECERDWFQPFAIIQLRQPQKPEPEKDTQKVPYSSPDVNVTADDGAKAIVKQAVSIAKEAGGSKIYVCSDYRAGSTTTSGNSSDHSRNDSTQAARDIAYQGVDALVGPPQPELDRAVVAIGKAFGRNYGNGKSGKFQQADSFNWHGFRIQIIWRTPNWGGHMGHIHIGAKKL